MANRLLSDELKGKCVENGVIVTERGAGYSFEFPKSKDIGHSNMLQLIKLKLVHELGTPVSEEELKSEI